MDKTPRQAPILTFSISDLWIGKGEDAGKFAYKTTVGRATKYVVTEGYIGYKLKIDGMVLNPIFSEVNGAVYFQGGNFILQRRAGTSWIMMKSGSWTYNPIPPQIPAGLLVQLNQSERRGRMGGGRLPTGGTSSTAIFSQNGTETESKTVEFFMPRWEKTAAPFRSTNSLTSNVLGTYADPDGVQDDLTIGVRLWRGYDGRYNTHYEKSLETLNKRFNLRCSDTWL